MVVALGSEHGLPDDADEDLLAVGLHLADPAHLAERSDYAERQRVEEVLGVLVGILAVAAVSLGRLEVG